MKIPKHLDQVAAETYKRVYNTLDALGKLNDIDGHSIELYATLYSRHRQAEEVVQKGGLVVMAKNGYPTQSPAAILSGNCIKEMRGLLRDWGVAKLIDRPERDDKGDKWQGLA